MSRPLPSPYQPKWTAIITRVPWRGVGALLAAICGIIVSLIVLKLSDRQPISNWRFQPNVYLSILSAFTNIMLHFAFTEAGTVYWWKEAARPNVKVGELHHHWNNFNSVWAAMIAGRHFNHVALACLLVTVAQINGPLLQRASVIAAENVTNDTVIFANAAPALPKDYTGIISGRGQAVQLLSAAFAQNVRDEDNKIPISITSTGCSSTSRCTGRLIAAGLTPSCTNYTQPFDFAAIERGSGGSTGAGSGITVFNTVFGWSADDDSVIMLDMLWKSTPACTGVAQGTNCTLQAATVSYPVIFDGSSGTIALDPASSIYSDTHVANVSYGNYESQVMYTDGGPTALGGLGGFLGQRYNSNMDVIYGGVYEYELDNEGSTSWQYASAVSTCNISFADPTADMLQAARELTFRAAVSSAGTNASYAQNVTAVQTIAVTEFRSLYQFFWYAVLVTLLATASTATVFIGYWKLRGRWTMSPLQTATAFDAAFLRELARNRAFEAGSSELLKRYGGMSAKHYPVSDVRGRSDLYAQFGTKSDVELHTLSRLEGASSETLNARAESRRRC